jgi:hypothetical protein
MMIIMVVVRDSAGALAIGRKLEVEGAATLHAVQDRDTYTCCLDDLMSCVTGRGMR